MKEMGGLILRNDGGTEYNRAYLAPCLRHFVQILLRRTSDTLGALSEIFLNLRKKKMTKEIKEAYIFCILTLLAVFIIFLGASRHHSDGCC